MLHLTALFQHHRDKPCTGTLTSSVSIHHRFCWVEDIINSGTKPHGHGCDLRASPLWQEMAVDRGQVEAMPDNTCRPASEQPELTKKGNRMMQCSVLQYKVQSPHADVTGEVGSSLTDTTLQTISEFANTYTERQLELCTPLAQSRPQAYLISNTQSCPLLSFLSSSTQWCQNIT